MSHQHQVAVLLIHWADVSSVTCPGSLRLVVVLVPAALRWHGTDFVAIA
ncbi:Uncharacterised protein [Mycobacterium tuberculosis]|uniref:Uncharacterized protein n=1 Tax=Mycobacterium tuberculosis TaxID=1773 RepID=A0A916LHH8_MYCTX|nr:Uncharacterised protein [Mycobacterium tuberculosis]